MKTYVLNHILGPIDSTPTCIVHYFLKDWPQGSSQLHPTKGHGQSGGVLGCSRIRVPTPSTTTFGRPAGSESVTIEHRHQALLLSGGPCTLIRLHPNTPPPDHNDCAPRPANPAGGFFLAMQSRLVFTTFSARIRRVEFYLASHSRPDSLISFGFIRFCP